MQRALDVFKLIVGGERAAHVKQGHDSRIPEAYAELVSKASGKFLIHLGWWSTWDHADEIEVRFLDALAWHSDAISERDAGAKMEILDSD